MKHFALGFLFTALCGAVLYYPISFAGEVNLEEFCIGLSICATIVGGACWREMGSEKSDDEERCDEEELSEEDKEETRRLRDSLTERLGTIKKKE